MKRFLASLGFLLLLLGACARTDPRLPEAVFERPTGTVAVVVMPADIALYELTAAGLHGVEIGGDMIPRMLDEVPILAVAACFAAGDTVIRDAAELRVKESDRIATTVSELTRLGASIEATEDGMIIHGKGPEAGALKGADCESHTDHRLAMSMAVAGLLADGETTVHGAPDASVSYPEFWQDLEMLVQDVR